ncbi:MAG: TetR/AcrR family transcriptional regulator [Pseudomonadota bacterium]|nr:TetR/AcrR family transcriptional regulator [Pseudomonadota bacterium]
MARRSDHSHDEIRDMILNAAETIVMEHGLKGLSTRKVTRDIGYTVGTLYLVFENLDDLVTHINARTLNRLYLLLTGKDTKDLTKKEQLHRLGQIYVNFAYADPHRWALIYEDRHSKDHPMPVWYKKNILQMFTIVEELLKPLAPTRTEGEITQAASSLWAGVYGICILGITQKLNCSGKEYVLELVEYLINNFLKGFADTEE